MSRKKYVNIGKMEDTEFIDSSRLPTRQIALKCTYGRLITITWGSERHMSGKSCLQAVSFAVSSIAKGDPEDA